MSHPLQRRMLQPAAGWLTSDTKARSAGVIPGSRRVAHRSSSEVPTLEVTPVLIAKQLDDLKDKLLSPAQGRVIEHSARVLCNGELKALYLRAEDHLPITEHSYYRALDALERMELKPAKDSDRSMVYQSCIGSDLLLGWMRPRNPHKEDWLRRGDRDQLYQALELSWMVSDFEKTLRHFLPDYYNHHREIAKKLVRPPDQRFNTWRKVQVKDEVYLAALRKLEGSRYYHFLGTHVFSTITLNHDILFGAHKDKSNVSGTLSCMTALGKYQGGVLCFPRLGISFDLRPGDLLIADTNREYHGTVGGISSRYSIVAYLHKSLLPKD